MTFSYLGIYTSKKHWLIFFMMCQLPISKPRNDSYINKKQDTIDICVHEDNVCRVYHGTKSSIQYKIETLK